MVRTTYTDCNMVAAGSKDEPFYSLFTRVKKVLRRQVMTRQEVKTEKVVQKGIRQRGSSPKVRLDQAGGT